MKNEDSSGIVEIATNNSQKERSFFMERITQDMRFRQSLMRYAEKYGVTRASRRYDKAPSYIYFWRKRWDGSIESLREKSRRPHHHPNQHTEEELKRFDVLPGITGWAAVHGRKTNTVEARFAYDNYYVENLSMWLDIKIFFMTIKAVFTNEGNEDDGSAEVKTTESENKEEVATK